MCYKHTIGFLDPEVGACVICCVLRIEVPLILVVPDGMYMYVYVQP